MTDLRSCSASGLQHKWQDKGSGRGFCLNCGASEHEGKLPHAADMHDAIYGGATARAAMKAIDWDQPLEPGPVKLVPQSEERARAQNDADTTGIGFLVDLKRVEPCRVVMLGPQRLPPAIDAEAIARIIIGPR